RIVADTASLGAAFAELLDVEPPPAGLRERILAAATAEPRLPRLPRDATPDPMARPTSPAVGYSSEPRIAPAAPARVVPRQRRFLRERAAIGALAAAIAVAVAVPVTLAASHHGSSSGVAAQAVTLTAGSGSGVGKAVVTDQDVFLLADGLRSNDAASSIYVLWVQASDGQPKPVATFDVAGSAPLQLAATKLPYSGSQIRRLAVSLESGRKAPARPTDVVLSGTAA
ncbi:MAG TPA: anti-sigma factor, partial [Frankiaceae bacterium]|nr:anti-sigma factor [Frankiaceae bacterium]